MSALGHEALMKQELYSYHGVSQTKRREDIRSYTRCVTRVIPDAFRFKLMHNIGKEKAPVDSKTTRG